MAYQAYTGPTPVGGSGRPETDAEYAARIPKWIPDQAPIAAPKAPDTSTPGTSPDNPIDLSSSGSSTTSGSPTAPVGYFPFFNPDKQPVSDPMVAPYTGDTGGMTTWSGTAPVIKPADTAPTATGDPAPPSGGSSTGGYTAPAGTGVPAGATDSGQLADLLAKLFAPQPVAGSLVPFTYAPGMEAGPAATGSGNKAILWIIILLAAAGGYYYYRKHKKGKAHASS